MQCRRCPDGPPSEFVSGATSNRPLNDSFHEVKQLLTSDSKRMHARSDISTLAVRVLPLRRSEVLVPKIRKQPIVMAERERLPRPSTCRPTRLANDRCTLKAAIGVAPGRRAASGRLLPDADRSMAAHSAGSMSDRVRPVRLRQLRTRRRNGFVATFSEPRGAPDLRQLAVGVAIGDSRDRR
jgi:hypothetical protein